jgi:hypothetical protein
LAPDAEFGHFGRDDASGTRVSISETISHAPEPKFTSTTTMGHPDPNAIVSAASSLDTGLGRSVTTTNTMVMVDHHPETDALPSSELSARNHDSVTEGKDEGQRTTPGGGDPSAGLPASDGGVPTTKISGDDEATTITASPSKPPPSVEAAAIDTDEELARRLSTELNASGRRRRPPAPTYVPAPLSHFGPKAAAVASANKAKNAKNHTNISGESSQRHGCGGDNNTKGGGDAAMHAAGHGGYPAEGPADGTTARPPNAINVVKPPRRKKRVRTADGAERWGLCKVNPVVTHSLKPPSFNP